MSIVCIGIDPGMSGGISIMHDLQIICVAPMPVAGRELDLSRLTFMIKTALEIYTTDKVVAYIEDVHSHPKQGVASTFKFGYVTGAVHGVLAALGVPRYTVRPMAWKKMILSGTKRDKQAAVDYITKAFPNVSLLATPRSTKPHDGMADAICISEYGYRTYAINSS